MHGPPGMENGFSKVLSVAYGNCFSWVEKGRHLCKEEGFCEHPRRDQNPLRLHSSLSLCAPCTKHHCRAAMADAGEVTCTRSLCESPHGFWKSVVFVPIGQI